MSAWTKIDEIRGATDYGSLTGKPTLGTAAAKDIPASGDASVAQVVYGTDTRLTNSRGLAGTIPESSVVNLLTDLSGKAPSIHTHAESDVTNLVADLAAKVGTSDSRLTDARTPTAHAPSHAAAGSDPLTLTEAQITGLVADLASKANTGATIPESQVTNLVSDLASKLAATDPSVTNARTPTAHAPSHKSGGSDAIKLDELAAPTDITALNVSTTAHGLVPKAPSDATKVLRGDAAFGTLAYASLSAIPSTFAPAPHAASHAAAGSDPLTLAESQITNLVTDLSGKAPSVHTHAESDVTGLVADLAGKVGTSDSRLSDARTPLAHKNTHITGGNDIIPSVTTSATGLVPIAPADATKVLRGDGAFGTLAYGSLSGTPTLGTASAKDVPASGNATATQVVYGSDTRLSDARSLLGSIAESAVTNLVTDLAAKAPTARVITAGSGLTGGGDLTADRTLAVDATVGRTGGTSHYYDYDDFFNIPLKFMSLANAGTTSSTGAYSAIIVDRPGIISLSPGTTGNGYAQAFALPIALGTLPITIRAVVDPISVAGHNVYYYMGLASSGGTFGGLTSFIGFQFNISVGPNWKCQTFNGTATIVDSGIAASQVWADLKIVVTQSQVLFYVNGVLKATISTNIPASTVPLYTVIVAANAGDTSNLPLLADLIEIDITTSLATRYSKSPI